MAEQEQVIVPNKGEISIGSYASKGKVIYTGTQGTEGSLVQFGENQYRLRQGDFGLELYNPNGYVVTHNPQNYFEPGYTGTPAPPPSSPGGSPTGINSIYGPSGPLGPTGVKISAEDSLTGGGLTNRSGVNTTPNYQYAGGYVGMTQQGQFPGGILVTAVPGSPTTAGQMITGLQGQPYSPGRLISPNEELRYKTTPEEYSAKTGEANFITTSGDMKNITSQDTLIPKYDYPLASSSPYRNATVKEEMFGDVIIRNALERQSKATVAIEELFGEQKVPFSFSAAYGKDFLRGIGAFVPKLSVQTLAGVQMAVGETVLREQYLFTGNVGALQNRNKEFVSAVAIVPIEIGKGLFEQVKTGSGLGELAGTVLAAKLIPGTEKNIEVIKFKDIKVEQVGKYTSQSDAVIEAIGKGGNVDRVSSGGTSQLKISVIGEKEVIPFTEESYNLLRAKESDYLVIRGNKESVVASNTGDFGVIKDVNRDFLIRNPFKQPPPVRDVNTINNAGTVQPSANQYAFPLSDVPNYPIKRLPDFDIVKTYNYLPKKEVSAEAFLRSDTSIAKARDTTVSIAAQNAKNQGGYIASDTFFEKFTPSTNVEQGMRTGTDFFTEQGVKRLPSPTITSTKVVSNTEADLFSTGNFLERKSIVGRSVTVKEEFKFSNPADIDSFRFAQGANTKIVTGFNRPRDTMIANEVIDSSGKVPKTMDLTKIKNRDDFSYYPIEIKAMGVTKKGYVGVINDAEARDFSSIIFKRTAQEELPSVKGVTASNGVQKTSGSFRESPGGQISISQEPSSIAGNPLDGLTKIRGKPVLDINVVTRSRGAVFAPIGNTSSVSTGRLLGNSVFTSPRHLPSTISTPVSSTRSSNIFSTSNVNALSTSNTNILGSTSISNSIQNNVSKSIQQSSSVSTLKSMSVSQSSIRNEMLTYAVPFGYKKETGNKVATKKKKKQKVSKFYTPSFTATDIGITSSSVPKGIGRSEFGIRPVIRRKVRL